MIILDATNRSLEIDLDAVVATNQLPFVASYVDINQSTFAMSAMSTNTGASNSTTAVTLVAAPGATTSRQLKYLSVKNSDTAAVLLWIQLNDNTTLREIWKGTLAVGDTLVYVDSLGFNVLDSNGAIKEAIATLTSLTLTSTLTMSGTAANIAIGSNYISNGGTDAGLSLDASNNGTLSGSLVIAGSSGINLNNTAGAISIANNSSGSNAIILSSTVVGVGISIGGDVNLYRLSANNLATDDSFTVGGNTVSGSGAGTLRADGGVRIGSDSTNNLLDDASNGAGTATLYIGNASINVTSDENIKSNIRPIDDGLVIVNALLPIEFDQDEERPFGDVRHYMGFGARHSHKVAPWAVHTQGDTGLLWKMRQEFLMAPTVRAVQQLDERLKALESLVLQ